VLVRRLLLLAALAPTLAGCGALGGAGGEAAPATLRDEGAGTRPASTGFALPGDEALSPAPPDPAADEHLRGVGSLPDGAFAGKLELTVSGLVGFAEPVAGSCSDMATAPAFRVGLSDGSSLELGFGEGGGTLLLSASGIEVRQTLSEVAMRAEAGTVTVDAQLLTDGTSERSGRLHLSGTCS
jgi:hypothetical protein